MKTKSYCSFIMLFTVIQLILSTSIRAQNSLFKGSLITHWDQDSKTNPNARAYNQLSRNFKQYDVFNLDVASLSHYVNASDGKAQFTLSLEGKYNWIMNIEPENLFAKDAVGYVLTENGKQESPLSKNIIFKGTLNGDEGKIRLTIDGDKISGYIVTGDKKIYLEQLKGLDNTLEENQYIVYEAEDVVKNSDLLCQAKKDEFAEEDVKQGLPSGRLAATCDGWWQNEMATFAPYSRFNAAGGISQVNTEILTILNNVQGNYNEFKVKLVIVEQVVSSCSTCDPWTATTNPQDLLTRFGAWGPTGFTKTHDQGVCFFKGAGSGVVGVAWVGAMCTKNRYSVCDKLGSAESNRVLVAHEMGHNFSAGHDGSSGYIMSPSVNITNTWSAASISSINSHIASRTCLACLPSNPPPVCNAPSGLLTENVQATTATLKWNAVVGATSYSVQYKASTASTWTSLNTSTNTLNVTGLQSGIAYNWQVRTVCSSTSNSVYTTGTNFTTTTTPPVCNAPSGLLTENVQATTATLKWNAVTGATSYSVQYKASTASTWTSLSASTNTLNVTGLQSGITYNWQVRTVCSSTSNSVYTTGSNFTTTDGTNGCNSPSNLQVESVQATSATVKWDAAPGSGATNGYFVQYKASTANYWTLRHTRSTSLYINNLVTGVTYNWKVKTSCQGAYLNGPNFITDSIASSGIFLNEPVYGIYPNPASNELHTRINAFKGENITVSILSIEGRELIKINKIAEEDGINEVIIDLGSIAKGTYLVQYGSGQLNKKPSLLVIDK